LGTFISLSSCGNNIKSELTTVLPAYLQTLKDNLGTDTLQDFEKSPYYNRLYKKRKITEEVNEARDLMWINGIDS